MIKRLVILVFIGFCTSSILAQRVVDFEYFLNPPFPRTLSQLMNQQGLQVIVFNDIPEPLEVYFASELTITDPAGNVIGSIRTSFDRFFESDRGQGSSITLGPNAEEIIDREYNFNSFGFIYEDLEFEGVAAQLFGENRDQLSILDPVLPEGTYNLCLTAFEKNTRTQLSPKVCSEGFEVRSADMWMTMPFSYETISCEEIESLVFDWDLNSPGDDECFDYRLEVVEVPADKIDADGEVQLDFVRETFDRPGQYRILDRSVSGETMYLSEGDFQSLAIDEEKTFAARVTASIPLGPSTECDVVLKNSATDIIIFKVSCEEDQDSDATAITCDNCSDAAPKDVNPINTQIVPQKYRAGWFTVEDIKDGSISGGKISGKGIVKTKMFGIDDLPLGVEFSDVQLNDEGRMISGEVKTLPFDYGRFSEITVNPDSDFTLKDLQDQSPEQYNNLVAAKEFTEYILGQTESVANDDGLRMPLGIDTEINGKEVVLSIDNILFTAEGAKMAIIINLPLPFNFSNGSGAYLSLALTELCFGPDGTMGSTRLNLRNDVPIISNSDGYDLLVKGCGSDCGDKQVDILNGTSVKIGCGGIEDLAFLCALRFDRDHILPFQQYYDELEVPVEERPEKVEAVFGFSTGISANPDRGQDWLVAAKVSPFEFKQLKGYGFSVGDEEDAAWLDMSVYRNPNNLEFPEGHRGNLDDTWKGLYISKARIYLPDNLTNGLDKDFNIGTNHMIFNMGEGQESSFSADIGFYRLFGREEVSLGKWEFGIDTVDISIIDGEFSRGRLIGEIGSPILHRDDFFTYNATMLHDDLESEGEIDYSFIIKPKSGSEEKATARLPLFLMNADLAKESHITIEYDKSKYGDNENNGFKFDMALIGAMSIDAQNVDFITNNEFNLSKLPLELFGLPFILKYDSNKNKPFLGSMIGFNVDIEQIIQNEIDKVHEKVKDVEGWVSDYENIINDAEKKDSELAGFKISIEKFEFGGTLDKPRLVIEPQVQFMENEEGWGGSTTLWIEGVYDDDQSKYVFSDAGIECIRVDVQEESFSFGGSICYVNDREAGIRRFDGTGLNVKLPVGVEVGMDFTIGSKYQNQVKDYSFWRFKALAYKPSGIPLGTSGLALYGLYGGITWNMLQTIDNLDSNSSTSNTQTRRQELFSLLQSDNTNRLRYQPSRGDKKFELGLLVATKSPKELFSLDGGLYYKSDGRRKSFGLEGSAYALSSISGDDGRSSIWANYNLDVVVEDFSEGLYTIDGCIDSYLRFPPAGPRVVYGASTGNKLSTTRILVEPHTSQFYLHMGNPSIREYAKVDVNLGIASESINAYFMMGTGLPVSLYIPEPLQEIIDGRSLRKEESGDEVDVGGDGTSGFTSSRPRSDGSGVAFGLHITKTVDVKPPIDNFVDLNASFVAGFDLNITKSDIRNCNGIVPGINGWYALGQVYLGFEGNIEIFKREVAYARVLALAQGGFPAPTWIDAELDIEYRIKAGPIGALIFRGASCVGGAVLDGAECGLAVVEDVVCWIGGCDGDRFDCDTERTEENCSLEKWGQALKNGYISGSFSIDLELGDKCLPIPNPNDIKGKFQNYAFIKNIIPGQNQENVDVFSEKIEVSFTERLNRNVGLPYVRNDGVVTTENVKVQLEEFSIKGNGLEKVWNSYQRGVYGGGTRSKYINILRGDLKPNKYYQIAVKLKVYYDQDKSFDEVQYVRFKTGDFPDEIPQKPWSSYPSEYQLFVHPQDVERGYFDYPAWVINDFLNDRRFGDATPEVEEGSISDALLSNVSVRIENIADPLDYYDQVLPHAYIRLINEYRGKVSFDIPSGLLLNTSYKVILSSTLREDNSKIELYSMFFKTSKFSSLREKMLSCEVNLSTLELKLPEPFDQYDQEAYELHLSPNFDETETAMEAYGQAIDPLFNSGGLQGMDLLYNLPGPDSRTGSVSRDSYAGVRSDLSQGSASVRLSNWLSNPIDVTVSANSIEHSGSISNKIVAWVWGHLELFKASDTKIDISKIVEAGPAEFERASSLQSLSSSGDNSNLVTSVTSNLGLPAQLGRINSGLSGLEAQRGRINIPSGRISDISERLESVERVVRDLSPTILSIPENVEKDAVFNLEDLWDGLNLLYNTTEYIYIGEGKAKTKTSIGRPYKEIFDQKFPTVYPDVRRAIDSFEPRLNAKLELIVSSKYSGNPVQVQL